MKSDPIWVKGWILYSTWAVLSGWILSIFGELNERGYFIAAGAVLLPGFFLRSYFLRAWKRGPLWRRPGKRWSRTLPAFYLALLVLSFVGGALYAPNNYDFLTYRLPRVLHWWSEGGWHWIDTLNTRMNYSGTGFEWMMAPLLILTHSDRFFFLVNIAAYALLPGLFFRVALQAKVRRRVAWNWMWILPGAYCFAMQAGSASNDSYAAVYVLAAVFFFLRASTSERVSDWAWGILAAALLTGSKASNLPLLLPCLVAALVSCRTFTKAWKTILGMSAVGLMVSFIPLALLNTQHTGHWSGDPANEGLMRLKNPVAGFVGNGLQIASQAFAPPFLPGAKKIMAQLTSALPGNLTGFLGREFPRFSFYLGELPQEEAAGLGLGVTILLLLGVGVGTTGFFHESIRRIWKQEFLKKPAFWTFLSTWISLAAYMGMMGSESAARLISTYYPLLLIPLLCLPGQIKLVQKPVWKFLANLAMVFAILAVVLTPSRPLFPAVSFFWGLEKMLPANAQLERAKTVYQVYQGRNDPMAALRKKMPDGIWVIGAVLGGNESEVSLWKPYGRSKVKSLLNAKSSKMQEADVYVATVQGMNQRNISGLPELESKLAADITTSISVILTVARGPESCYLLSPRQRKNQ